MASHGGNPAVRALRKALERGGGAVAADMPGATRAAEDRQRFERALETAANGGAIVPRDLPSATALRGLVGATRKALIDELRDARDVSATGAIADALRAIEKVEHSAECESARRFAMQLGGPDAMQLVVSVAHDMRSPLTAILFLVDSLRRSLAPSLRPAQQRQLLLVHSASLGMCALARDVIDLATNGTGLVEDTPRPFSVRECLTNAEDVVAPIAEEKGLALVFDAQVSDHRIGQPVALSRVILNLVTNALKFTDEGEVRVTVVEKEPSLLEFAVEDTGRGIPDKVVHTLFDAFRTRERSDDYVFSSAGLGLSICQTLVSAMGGDLRVSSCEGKGTRFSFEIEAPAI